jgi:hypothetical protein
MNMIQSALPFKVVMHAKAMQALAWLGAHCILDALYPLAIRIVVATIDVFALALLFAMVSLENVQ